MIYDYIYDDLDPAGDRNDLHRSQMVSNLRRAAEQARTCVPWRIAQW